MLEQMEIPRYEQDRCGDFIVNKTLSDCGKYFIVEMEPNPEIWNSHENPEQWCKENHYFNYYSSYDNGYIGRKEEVDFYESKGLILLQKPAKDFNTCAIGFQPEENKWYGWSHRAMYGFTIGDEVKEGDLTSTTGFIHEYAIQHPEECYNLPVGFKALTLYDAKRMAIAFARAVS